MSTMLLARFIALFVTYPSCAGVLVVLLSSPPSSSSAEGRSALCSRTTSAGGFHPAVTAFVSAGTKSFFRDTSPGSASRVPRCVSAPPYAATESDA